MSGAQHGEQEPARLALHQVRKGAVPAAHVDLPKDLVWHHPAELCGATLTKVRRSHWVEPTALLHLLDDVLWQRLRTVKLQEHLFPLVRDGVHRQHGALHGAEAEAPLEQELQQRLDTNLGHHLGTLVSVPQREDPEVGLRLLRDAGQPPPVAGEGDPVRRRRDQRQRCRRGVLVRLLHQLPRVEVEQLPALQQGVVQQASERRRERVRVGAELQLVRARVVAEEGGLLGRQPHQGQRRERLREVADVVGPVREAVLQHAPGALGVDGGKGGQGGHLPRVVDASHEVAERRQFVQRLVHSPE
mmetsp:Transcript_27584/g.72235  ORF Transcript_27584/g.72235 Transcript_27584/m.72235 type:complete len:302 (-) Transcript_27584:398-1303(-)